MFLSGVTTTMVCMDLDDDLLDQAYDETHATESLLNSTYSEVVTNPSVKLNNVKPGAAKPIEENNPLNEVYQDIVRQGLRHIQTTSSYFGTAWDIAFDCIALSFLFNLVSGNTLKQKAWGNLFGIAGSFIHEYGKKRPTVHKIHPAIPVGAYLCGALGGTVTRATLNKTLIPLTAYTFRLGMSLFRK